MNIQCLIPIVIKKYILSYLMNSIVKIIIKGRTLKQKEFGINIHNDFCFSFGNFPAHVLNFICGRTHVIGLKVNALPNNFCFTAFSLRLHLLDDCDFFINDICNEKIMRIKW